MTGANLHALSNDGVNHPKPFLPLLLHSINRLTVVSPLHFTCNSCLALASLIKPSPSVPIPPYSRQTAFFSSCLSHSLSSPTPATSVKREPPSGALAATKPGTAHPNTSNPYVSPHSCITTPWLMLADSRTGTNTDANVNHTSPLFHYPSTPSKARNSALPWPIKLSYSLVTVTSHN